MLSFIALVWGILSIIGMALGFVPSLTAWSWVNLPFAVLGASVGIASIFVRKIGGSKFAVIGIALCMVASIVGLLRLVAMDSTY
jgi:hypothetical protein